MGALKLSPPRPLAPSDRCDDFRCGKVELDHWLIRRAHRNETAGHSRTYVVTAPDSPDVLAYYSLAAGAVARSSARKSDRRNAPDPIPVIILARLAVHLDIRAVLKGTGRHLLRDALIRATAAADTVGARALVVHAIDEAAAGLYRAHGFEPSPNDPLMLFTGFGTVRKALLP